MHEPPLPPPSYSAPTTLPSPMQLPSASSILGGLFVAAAVLMFFASLNHPYFSESSYSNRFKSDIAVGATANATEFLAENHARVDAGEVMIAGLLLILIGRVGVLNVRLSSMAPDGR